MCFDPKIPQPGTPNMASEITVGEAALPAKARFCVKCKDYFPVACFVGKDGTDDATLCNRHEPAKNGLRYCRGCGDYVALNLFPRGSRPGYACRKHVNVHGGGREIKQKRMNDPIKKRRTWQWKMAYDDGKKFKQIPIGMCQQEIEIEINKVDKQGTGNYVMMPMDTRKPITTENSVVVTLEERKVLMKLVNKQNIEEYTRILLEIQSAY